MQRSAPYLSTALLAALLALTGCDALVDGSDAAASITSRSLGDAKQTWVDAFSYHPKRGPQAPQTRYCYKMVSDIVCYDSLQPGLTAKLVGYQDADKISWVQPGGGSLGASGGDAIAYPAETAGGRVDPKSVYKVKKKLNNEPAENPMDNMGIVQTMDLPPPK